jgi:hypothetical protein
VRVTKDHRGLKEGKVLIIKGRVIKAGKASGEAIVSPEPISFFGGVDPETGEVIEKGHPLEGQKIAGKILVFPTGKGSTVGSYTLYRLKQNGLAPAAIINSRADPVVAVGAIMADIPMVDLVPCEEISTGDFVEVEGDEIRVWKADFGEAGGLADNR